MRTPEMARYLYAVTRGLDPGVLDTVTGLQGRTLNLVEYDGLSAVVSDVPLSDFDEDGLRHHLEDIDWLEPAVRVHDAVIQAVTAQAATAPMRFATICFDDDGVRARLKEWYFALVQVLDRVDGCAEWSLKIFARTPARVGASAAADRPTSGADYLRLKQQYLHDRGADEAAALDAANEVHDELRVATVASRLLPHQDPRLTGHDNPMLLNAAYLVPVAGAEAFEATVAGLASRHPQLEVEARGPWAPYSFAMLDQR